MSIRGQVCPPHLPRFIYFFTVHCPVQVMEAKILRNKREQLRRGRKTLFKKAHKLAKVHGIDIAVIMHKNGRYFTYRSLDQESWPPTMKQIVSRYSLFGFL
jgi:hypothetical protein